MYYDFVFQDKRPTDFDKYIRVASRDIDFPEKTKIIASVPFSNQVYDFSTMYGDQAYSERKVKYVLNVIDPSNFTAQRMQALKTKLINWLMKPNRKVPLYDDTITGYHFLGEVQSENSIEDNFRYGELTITFTCYPFMIKDLAEGNDIWDDFNFETDVAQNVEYDITGSKTITLINVGIQTAYPSVTCSSNMTISVGGTVYQLKAGVSTGLPLAVDANTLTIAGNGHIKLDWHREVI